MGASARAREVARGRLTAACAACIWCAVALQASCSGDDETRRGGLGESCLRTDDCVSPLPCIQNVCGGPATTSHGGHGATTASGAGGVGGSAGSGGVGAAGGAGAHAGQGGGAGAPSGGHGGSGAGAGGSGGAGGQAGFGGEQPWCPGVADTVNLCDDCLDTVCHAEACACEDECFAIEACLETVCRSLTDTEESDCMVYCQGLHLAGKQAHLNVAWCSYYDTACAPSCPGGYPASYQACRLAAQQGSCAVEWAACDASADCLLYRDCTTACGTLQACLDCSGTPETMAARLLYESRERCVAAECIAESWW